MQPGLRSSCLRLFKTNQGNVIAPSVLAHFKLKLAKVADTNTSQQKITIKLSLQPSNQAIKQPNQRCLLVDTHPSIDSSISNAPKRHSSIHAFKIQRKTKVQVKSRSRRKNSMQQRYRTRK
ncbi:hypothetical protein VTL71DRAFT_4798 [Oculimacula yallundae]|uniref:Uncharacterized protein n=1 Tax=Oculimacula yallundae TaxID=86028 RepID=A0ABR4C317_9HELO